MSGNERNPRRSLQVRMTISCGGISELDVYLDSRNTISWITKGRCNSKVNDPVAVANLLLAIAGLTREIILTLNWIPRDHNLAGIYIEGN
jgi:hypothetical protein